MISPFVTSMQTMAAAVPEPDPMEPFGAMVSFRIWSAAVCTFASMVRYTSLPFEGAISLTTWRTLPSASATSRRWPWSPASRFS